MIENLFGKNLPATLTFIVGLLGIISQLSINFFSSHNTLKQEKEKLYSKNLYGFYLPLLAQLRKYQYTCKLLRNTGSFSLANRYYPNQDAGAIQYKQLQAIYTEIEDLSSKNYGPINDSGLNSKTLDFLKHITQVNCRWESGVDENSFNEIIKADEKEGYEVKPLIQSIEAYIAKEIK